MIKKYTELKSGYKSTKNQVPEHVVNFLLNYSKSLETIKTKVTKQVIHKN